MCERMILDSNMEYIILHNRGTNSYMNTGQNKIRARILETKIALLCRAILVSRIRALFCFLACDCLILRE